MEPDNRHTHRLPIREHVPEPPTGKRRWSWYGPGLLWMLSAVGTGSILFTPRVGSVYGYELLWLLLVVVFFMWVMIREMARFTIVTGRTILDGMSTLPGPKGWAIWLIFIPQLLAASVGIAGLSAVVGSAFAVSLPGSNQVYAELILLLCVVLTTTGQYGRVEQLSRYMAIVLMVIAVVSAVAVMPSLGTLGSGLVPQWPDDPDLYVIAPWVGTILAGSMGIVWFSYWTATRGYGGGLETREPRHGDDADDETDDEQASGTRPESECIEPAEPPAKEAPGDEPSRSRAIVSWLGTMTGAATLGVVGGGIVITAFLILGAELLGPAGIVPEGAAVAEDLTRLFSEVWGEAGRYLILVAIIVAIGGSVLANQDGWGRSFADMLLILSRNQRQSRQGSVYGAMRWATERTGWSFFRRRNLKRLFIITVTGLIPAVIVWIFEDPVQVMSVSGIIAAVHTPFIVLTALLVNLLRLPLGLRPGAFHIGAMSLSGLFYLGFAVLYFWNLATGQ